MSANDIVTALLAFGAVLVSAVALAINDIAGKRAAVSALTDLALRVSKRTTAYRDLGEASQEQFLKGQDIEVLIRQADYLVQQLNPRLPRFRVRFRSLRSRFPALAILFAAPKPPFPETVAITLAEALELVVDPWWADTYWLQAAATSDLIFRAKTKGYWALALWDRGEYDLSRSKTQEAVDGLTIQSTDASIIRGKIYLQMGRREPESVFNWLAKARQQFSEIPGEERRSMHLDFVDDAQTRIRE